MIDPAQSLHRSQKSPTAGLRATRVAFVTFSALRDTVSR
jgi:hypothetical protein